MPSDCRGACDCACRSSSKRVRDIEDMIENLERENEKLLSENKQLKDKLAKLSASREKIIDELARKLKNL